MSAESLDGCMSEQEALSPETDLQEKGSASLAHVLNELLLTAAPDGQSVPTT